MKKAPFMSLFAIFLLFSLVGSGVAWVTTTTTTTIPPTTTTTLPPPPPPGDQGCTPGFWKNHLDSWPLGVSPNDDFDTTFGVNLFNPDVTLLTALNTGGGGNFRLGRHGTAAYLNSLSGFYPFSPAEVIILVQAGQTDLLEAMNELGCPGENDNDGNDPKKK